MNLEPYILGFAAVWVFLVVIIVSILYLVQNKGMFSPVSLKGHLSHLENDTHE